MAIYISYQIFKNLHRAYITKGLSEGTLEYNGTNRSYFIFRPEGEVTHIILCLHGRKSTNSDIIKLTGMGRLSEHGALVIFPRGSLHAGLTSYQWDLQGDVPFLAELSDFLLNEFPEAERRVCVCGISNGARMGSSFASAHPELVACLGACAGLRATTRDVLNPPVPVIAFHGLEDHVNPYEGHSAVNSYWVESVVEAATSWARSNGNVGEAVVTEETEKMTKTQWGADGSTGEVVLYTFNNAGHTWPDGDMSLLGTLFLGHTSHQINATDAIWNFFISHFPHGKQY